ncbi:MAG: Nif3-like dinuclear metal center hexameric protein, partial [Pseudomonadota bacterium]|nr:Nif3-like dinuclear metal center hexameric protein [Pseudomonadota bacterium]
LLIKNNINLFGYHLPLDEHPEVGNNVSLGKILGIQKMKSVDDSFLWQGELDTDLKTLTSLIEKKLDRAPQVFGETNKSINSIAWCTGGAQGFIDEAINLNVDLYLSGEVSERTPAAAKENNIIYISAGHHATERYGVQSLCKHLSSKFNLKHQFLEVENSV